MPVKRKDLEKCKQESTSGNHFGELSQLDLPAMSLMSLLQFGSGLLLKEAVTQEITSYLGRGHYRHGEEFKGHRNGCQKTRLDTPMGAVEYDRPKLAYAPDFKSQFQRAHGELPGGEAIHRGPQPQWPHTRL